VSSVTPSTLDEYRDRDEIFVLDIRPEDDYERSHIDESHNIPVYHDLRGGDTDALTGRLDELPDADEVEVVTVCKAGVVARTATDVLEEQGYEASTLSGGMKVWRHYERDSIVYRVLSVVWRILP
jgi:rhodanese-related sulfurtransferase